MIDTVSQPLARRFTKPGEATEVSTLRGTGEVSEQDFDLASLLDGRGESGR